MCLEKGYYGDKSKLFHCIFIIFVLSLAQFCFKCITIDQGQVFIQLAVHTETLRIPP